MIEQEHLRIGNLVLDGDKVVTVDGLQFSGRIVTEDKTYDDYKRPIKPEPIPLTEEWLLKLGFEKTREGKFEHNVNPLVIYKNERMGFYYGEAIGISHNHVHQLQNLYFALTGEELTIKP